jgi:hypothetical protein
MAYDVEELPHRWTDRNWTVLLWTLFIIAVGNLLNHGVLGENCLFRGVEALETQIFSAIFHVIGGFSATAGSYEKFNDDHDQHDMDFASTLLLWALFFLADGIYRGSKLGFASGRLALG